MANPLTDWLEGGDDSWDSGDGDEGSPAPARSGRAERAGSFADEPQRLGGRRLLQGLAVVPWAVIAVVAVAWMLSPDDDAALQAADAGSPPESPVASPADSPLSSGTGPAEDASATAAPLPLAAPPVPPQPANEDLLRAAAVLVVRATLSGPLQDGDEPPVRERYVDLAAAESVHRAGESAVVTVVAVIVEGADGRWESARPARFAVPLSVGPQGAAPLGPPWALPPPELEVRPPAWEAVADDPVMDGVAEALESAGYDAPAIEGIARVAGLEGIVLVETVAVAPGDLAERRHEVWLSESPHLRVLGAPPSDVTSSGALGGSTPEVAPEGGQE